MAITTSPTCKASGVAERHGRKIGGIELEQRDVGFRVAADEARRVGAPIFERHLDLAGIGDDMAVGEHVTAARIHDHPGAGAQHVALARQIR